MAARGCCGEACCEGHICLTSLTIGVGADRPTGQRVSTVQLRVDRRACCAGNSSCSFSAGHLAAVAFICQCLRNTVQISSMMAVQYYVVQQYISGALGKGSGSMMDVNVQFCKLQAVHSEVVAHVYTHSNKRLCLTQRWASTRVLG